MSEPNGQLPNSKKIYVSGKLHPKIRVPFREITLALTKSSDGQIEVNDPVRVYDTSGPWGDPDFHGDVTQGLPPLRGKWIRDRADVEKYEGRKVQPIDDGYLSQKHAAMTAQRPTSNSDGGNGASGSSVFDVRRSAFGVSRKVLRAKSHPVTQLYYARKGVITPEMEFIAIRENMGRESRKSEIRNPKSETNSKLEIRNSDDSFDIRHSTFGIARNDLRFAHQGNSFGASILVEITPEFGRSEVSRGQ